MSKTVFFFFIDLLPISLVSTTAQNDLDIYIKSTNEYAIWRVWMWSHCTQRICSWKKKKVVSQYKIRQPELTLTIEEWNLQFKAS